MIHYLHAFKYYIIFTFKPGKRNMILVPFNKNMPSSYLLKFLITFQFYEPYMDNFLLMMIYYVIYIMITAFVNALKCASHINHI